MSEAERARLVKLLRMFSSVHDGEVASAARRAYEMLKRIGLDWDHLIVRRSGQDETAGATRQRTANDPKPETADRATDDPETADDDSNDEKLRRCADLFAYLSQWEREFVPSVANSYQEWGRLTDKQQAALDRIVAKLRQRGVWGR